MSIAAMRMEEGRCGWAGESLACYMSVIYCMVGRAGRHPTI
jgi:hypothetical protein